MTGATSVDPRISNWMDRSVGKWTSYRRYIMGVNKKPTQDRYTTSLTITKTSDSSWTSAWCSRDENDKYFNGGEMEMFFSPDNKCSRSRGYMSDNPDTSDVTVVDDDCIVWETSYNGMSFREEIRLCENDSMRLRQTYGKKTDGEVFLVGQYYEHRESGDDDVSQDSNSD